MLGANKEQVTLASLVACHVPVLQIPRLARHLQWGRSTTSRTFRNNKHTHTHIPHHPVCLSIFARWLAYFLLRSLPAGMYVCMYPLRPPNLMHVMLARLRSGWDMPCRQAIGFLGLACWLASPVGSELGRASTGLLSPSVNYFVKIRAPHIASSDTVRPLCALSISV
jgi:hypothetical protein